MSLGRHASVLRNGARRSVVVIGPGKLGCGYLARLFATDGWRVSLAARTEERAERIRAAGQFRVRVASETRSYACESFVVGSPAFVAAVAAADLVVTAVGSENLAALGPSLARALAARGGDPPLDVWTAENGDVASDLASAVRSAASEAGIRLRLVGFAGAIPLSVVSRGDWSGDGIPEFVADGTQGLLVDETRTVGLLPRLPGLGGTRAYRARFQEKIFGFNLGHALLAYLGARCGYRRIDEAAGDPLLRTLVETCLLETRRAVLHTHPVLGNDVSAPVADAMRRYGDVALEDPVQRVARRPLRKLVPEGPLVGAAELVRRAFGRSPSALALGIACALLYRDESDAQARELAARLALDGAESVLRDVCGLASDGPLGRAVITTYQRMSGLTTATVRAQGGRRRPAAFAPPASTWQPTLPG